MYLVVYLIGFKIHVTITDDALQLLLTRDTIHVPRCPVYTRVQLVPRLCKLMESTNRRGKKYEDDFQI